MADFWKDAGRLFDLHRPPELRRLTPYSRSFGFDRGKPVDRFYIEDFLARFASDVRGDVLEIGDSGYTRRFGGEQVAHADVLDERRDNPNATLNADLVDGAGIESARFDCVILTQTLQFLFEPGRAAGTVARILKPGGVVLATVPGISQISRFDMDREGDWWRFTTRSASRLFADAFPGGHVHVEAYGNVMSAIAFLHGLACEELARNELELRDPDYELLIAIRAVKATA